MKKPKNIARSFVRFYIGGEPPRPRPQVTKVDIVKLAKAKAKAAKAAQFPMRIKRDDFITECMTLPGCKKAWALLAFQKHIPKKMKYGHRPAESGKPKPRSSNRLSKKRRS